MKKNIGSADRIIRIVAAAFLIVLFFLGIADGVLGIIFLAIAVMFLITSFVGNCPLYPVLGINTCGKKEKKV